MGQESSRPSKIAVEHPGFTIIIEIDRPMSTLSANGRTQLLSSVSHAAHLAESLLGNARLIFRSEHQEWSDAGRVAMKAEEMVSRQLPTIGIELCRTDLWPLEPIFDHEPEGLGTLPAWCHRTDPRRHSTVVVEIEPESEIPPRLRDSDLISVMHNRRDARVSHSSSGRPHLIVEQHFGAASAAMSTAKPAFTIAKYRSITRIRSVRADIYRSEVAHLAPTTHQIDPPRLPNWQLVTDEEGNRSVVVTDLRVRIEGWSVDSTTADGAARTNRFSLGCVWRSDDGVLNALGDGRVVDAWEASIEPGANVDAFVAHGERLEVDPWDAMAAWLVESMYGKPVGFIIELGPESYIPDEDDDNEEVPCVQIVFLGDDVLMLRRSRTELGHLLLADHSPTGLQLDTWHHDGHFEDCTDGYIFTKDTRLIARTCVAWFRYGVGVENTDDIGCSYRTADELPRHS